MPNSAAAVPNFVEPPNQFHCSTAIPPVRIFRHSYKADTVLLLDRHGHRRHMDLAAIDMVVRWACSGIPGVETNRLVALCREALHNGMKADEVGAALVEASLPLIESAAGYSQVCARLLLDSLWDEASRKLGQQTAHGGDFRFAQYPGLFKAGIFTGVELGLLPANLLAFDLDQLARTLRPERDKAFTYPELLQLCDQRLLQHQGNRIELPQAYYMRLAMVLALEEGGFNQRAIEIYLGSAGR